MRIFFDSKYLRVFSLLSLLLIIISVSMFFLIGQKQANDLTINIATKQALKISKQIEFILEAKQMPNDVLYTRMQELLKYQDVLRLVLFNSNKSVVYSTDPLDNVTVQTNIDNLKMAIDGESSSFIRTMIISNEFTSIKNDIKRKVVVVYFPLRGIRDIKVVNLFMDVSYYENQLADLNLKSSISMTIGSLIFYILLLVITIKIDVARVAAECKMKTDHEKLEAKIRERTYGIQKSKNSLENEITLRTLIEEQLKKSEMELEKAISICTTISNISPNAHIVANSKGIILQTNPGTTRMFGYSNKELIGKHVSILAPSYLHDQYSKSIFNYHKYKRTNSTERRILIRVPNDCKALTKSGKEFPVNIYFKESVIKEEEFFICIIEDSKRLS